ncbi:hypothetical protein ACFQ7F_06475 [Streptomyces sp. NPDC056486]|uniref:hypothetical protein n=1 Tax=Streptomyces sp. NPDC056486 TaxID=3345835 RepID=UPI003699D1AC
MRGYFADDLLLIVPTNAPKGVRLFGEVLGSHKGALVLALTAQSRATQEITVDLTGVHYIADSALEILVALANHLPSPQRLVIRATPALALRERFAAQGWDHIEILQLIDV